MSLTTPGYVMHATIHHLIYLLSSPVPQQYLEIFADIYINLDEL